MEKIYVHTEELLPELALNRLHKNAKTTRIRKAIILKRYKRIETLQLILISILAPVLLFITMYLVAVIEAL